MKLDYALVEAAAKLSRALLDEYEKTRNKAPEAPFPEDNEAPNGRHTSTRNP
jgi:hypothetical protein